MTIGPPASGRDEVTGRAIEPAPTTGRTRTLGILCVVAAAGLAALVGFHRPSQAQPSQGGIVLTPGDAPAGVTRAVWEPTVVNAPGWPLQCTDGAWTRTAVRGGCVRHGGVTY